MHDLELKILQDFEDLKTFLSQWGTIVDNKIIEILTNGGLGHEIKIFPKSRLKDDKSFLSKALWRKKGYNEPLLLIEDKIATRIVLLKTDDISNATSLLLNNKYWNAKITKDLLSTISETPQEFGYQSMHIVVHPNADDTIFAKDILPLLTCEIQIRTLLQHAFAEISHDSTYKGPYMNDAEIIRSLSKSMALMEATDDYFLRIFEMMADDTRKYRNYIKELTNIFIKYQPSYAKEKLDIQLTDIIFELLTKKEIQIGQLQEFVLKCDSEIKTALNGNNTHLFQQPIILLIAYYIFNFRNFLNNNWPLSDTSKKEVFKGFGFSLDA